MNVGNALVHGCAIEKMALTLMKLEALIFTLLEDKCNLIRFELNSFIIEKSHFNSIGWQTLKKRTLVSYIC